MNSDIFQNTFDLLLDYLPADWNKLIFYAAYTNGSYSMKYFTKSEDSGWIDCFSQKDITRSDLIKLFIKINNSFAIIAIKFMFIWRNNKYNFIFFFLFKI